MKRFFLHILLALFVLSVTGEILQEKKRVSKDYPPGTVWLKDNLYIDQTEIRNIDYKEYLYWLGKVHGKQSELFQNALPDTTVWSDSLTIVNSKYKSYFRHPDFNKHPVVGISYDQATEYCKWRTDRVNEKYLIQEGLLTPNNNPGKKYITYLDSILQANKKVEYRLPNIDEWEYAAKGGDPNVLFGWGSSSFRKASGKNKGSYLGNFMKIKAIHNKKELTDQSNSFLSPVESFQYNGYKIYNMSGNVAEMTSTKGVAMGGSWAHQLKDMQIGSKQRYKEQEEWLGFRCVCIVYE